MAATPRLKLMANIGHRTPRAPVRYQHAASGRMRELPSKDRRAAVDCDVVIWHSRAAVP